MKTVQKNKNISILMFALIFSSIVVAFGNLNIMFASGDFDKQLILKGDNGDVGDYQPLSIGLNLENLIIAYQNQTSIKIDFNEYIGDVNVGIVKNSANVYQNTINTMTESSLIINIEGLQSGNYRLNFEDAQGRKAYTDFKIE